MISILHDATGSTAIEYGLIAALVAALLIGALSLTSDGLGELYEATFTLVGDEMAGASENMRDKNS